ncbi:MAG: hypothetical protein ACYSW8_30890, partial [Planctomycetota bacterium]
MLDGNLTSSQKLGVLICVLVARSAVARVIYVDADGPRIGSGSNWTDAYVHLQDALKRAQFGDEIRVAQGIYKPD